MVIRRALVLLLPLLGSNNIFPWTWIFTKMASGHDGIALQEIQREQDSIDSLIDSLLSSTLATSLHGPLSAENKEINTPVVKSPAQAKMGEDVRQD